MLEVDEILPDESILTKLRTKGFWLYFFTFIVAPVSYWIKIIVSKSMSVEDLGLIYSLLWFIWIISVYNDLWLTDALQYYLPKYILKKDYLRAKGLMVFTFSMQALSGLLIGWGLYFSSNWLAIRYFDSPDAGYLLKFFWLYFLVVNFFQVLQSFFFAIQRVSTEKLIEFCRMWFVLLVTVLFRQTDSLSLFNLSLARFIGLLVATFMATYIFYRKFYKRYLQWTYILTKQDMKQQLSYGLRSLLGANAWTIISQIDLQLVIYYFGKQMAGYRTNYMSLNSLSAFIFVPLLSFMFPVFTELVEKKQFEKLWFLRNRLLWAICWYWLLLWIWVHFWGLRWAEKIFWSKYFFSGELLQYTAFVLFTPLLGIVNFQYIRSFGNMRRVTLAQVAVLVVHIGTSLFIIHYSANVRHLALVLMVSHFLFFVVTQWYIWKRKLGNPQ